jgi:hypothetical protein
MTIPYTFTNGTLANAVEVNNNFESVIFAEQIYSITSSQPAFSVLPHSTTTISALGGSGDLWQNTGSGWSEKYTTLLDNMVHSVVCKATPASAIAIEGAGGNTGAYTSDSGASWAATAAATFGTAVYDVSFPTTTVLVVGGNDAGGTDHVIRSVNQGTAFANAATSPTEAVYALDMYDGSDGFCIGSAGKIFITADGGDTWTDTTFTCSSSIYTSMWCYSSSAFIACTAGSILKYTTAGAANATEVTKLVVGPRILGVVGDSNGILYVVIYSSDFSGTGTAYFTLLRSDDSGDTWESSQITTDDTNIAASLTYQVKHCLYIDSADTIYFTDPNGYSIYKFPARS